MPYSHALESTALDVLILTTAVLVDLRPFSRKDGKPARSPLASLPAAVHVQP